MQVAYGSVTPCQFQKAVAQMDGAFEEIDRLTMINACTVCTTFSWQVLYHWYFVLTQVIMTIHSQQVKWWTLLTPLPYAGRITVPAAIKDKFNFGF